jgi:hypothetical protein
LKVAFDKSRGDSNERKDEWQKLYELMKDQLQRKKSKELID